MRSRLAPAGVSLLVAAAVAATVEWPLPRALEGVVSSTVERYLGASLAYREGAVSLLRGARFSGVVLAGPRGDTVTAEEVTASLPWRTFIDLAIGRIPPLGTLTARGVVVGARRGRDGRFAFPLDPPLKAGRFVVRLEDARLRYRDLPLGLDHVFTGIGGSIRFGERMEGDLGGALPEKVGGRWRLLLVPAGARKVEADLALLRDDGKESGRAKGVVTVGGAGAFSGEIDATLEAGVAARLLQRPIPASGLLRFEGRVEGGAKALSIVGDVRADRMEAAGVGITGLTARIRADERRIVASNGSATVFGGRAAIAAAAVPWSNLDAWSASGRLEGADAATATRGRLGSASMTGRLAADFDLRGAPAAPYGTTGTVGIDLARGSIDAAPLGRLVRLTGDRGLKPLPVERLTARLGLRTDGLTADRVRLSSPKIGARGDARIASDERLSGEMTFLVPEALTERLAGPVARTLPREGGRVIVPASLGGTLSHPEVSPNVAGVVVGAAVGVVGEVAENGGRAVGGAAEGFAAVLRGIFSDR